MSEPISPQNQPYVLRETSGKKRAWCACGRSATQPFCDGTHKGSDLSPVIVTVEKEGDVAWCGCKRTKTPPYCDGSHALP